MEPLHIKINLLLLLLMVMMMMMMIETTVGRKVRTKDLENGREPFMPHMQVSVLVREEINHLLLVLSGVVRRYWLEKKQRLTICLSLFVQHPILV